MQGDQGSGGKRSSGSGVNTQASLGTSSPLKALMSHEPSTSPELSSWSLARVLPCSVGGPAVEAPLPTVRCQFGDDPDIEASNSDIRLVSQVGLQEAEPYVRFQKVQGRRRRFSSRLQISAMVPIRLVKYCSRRRVLTYPQWQPRCFA